MKTDLAQMLLTLVMSLSCGIFCATKAENNDHLDGVLKLVAFPCGSHSKTTFDIQVSDTDNLLMFLERELNKTMDKAKESARALKVWKALLDEKTAAKCRDYVRKLQLKKTQHGHLSELENSRFHIYVQLANYANFLTKQETAAYVKNTGTTGMLRIENLRSQIGQVMCKLRELLSENNKDLKVLATQMVTGHVVPVETMEIPSVFKRAVCAFAVEMMFDTIRQMTL